MEVISDRVVINLREAALLRADTSSEIAEMINGQRQVRSLGFADRLAVVDRLDHSEQIELLLHAVGDFVQDAGALGGRRAAPGLPRAVSGVERELDVLRGRSGVGADDAAIDRGDIVECLTFNRRDPFAADPIFIM